MYSQKYLFTHILYLSISAHVQEVCDAVGGFSFLFKFSFLFGAHTVAHIMAQMHMISEQHSNSKNNKSSVFTLGEKIFSKRYLKLQQINNLTTFLQHPHFYQIIHHLQYVGCVDHSPDATGLKATNRGLCLFVKNRICSFLLAKSYLPESVSENLH